MLGGKLTDSSKSIESEVATDPIDSWNIAVKYSIDLRIIFRVLYFKPVKRTIDNYG